MEKWRNKKNPEILVDIEMDGSENCWITYPDGDRGRLERRTLHARYEPVSEEQARECLPTCKAARGAPTTCGACGDLWCRTCDGHTCVHCGGHGFTKRSERLCATLADVAPTPTIAGLDDIATRLDGLAEIIDRELHPKPPEPRREIEPCFCGHGADRHQCEPHSRCMDPGCTCDRYTPRLDTIVLFVSGGSVCVQGRSEAVARLRSMDDACSGLMFTQNGELRSFIDAAHDVIEAHFDQHDVTAPMHEVVMSLKTHLAALEGVSTDGD